MKKNLWLLGLLIALLVGTYFFQEVRTNKAFEQSLTQDHLINAEDIKSISWNDVNAVKKDGQWWAGDKLLSANIFKQIEKRIGQVKKIKNVEGEKESYFTHPLEIKVNGESWLLGDLTLDRQGFYLARNSEVMVAINEGEGQELTDEPGKVVETKLEDFKQALRYKLADLSETQLFRFYPKLPLGTVTIESDGRPAYELNFITNETIPPPVPGVKPHNNLLEKFTSLLTQMTIKQEVPYSEKLKFQKLGHMLFQNQKGKVNWELWLSSAKSADSFMVDSQAKKAWKMVGGTLKAFFIHHQDYWDKKVIPTDQFKNFTRLKTIFTQGERTALVEIINREPLSFESNQYKIDTEKMNILFQYVFNLSEKDQADRISQLSKSERKTLLAGDHLRVEVMGQEIIFWRKQDELIVVNLTQDYKAHFLVTQQSFRATFEDVIKLNK
ncbi:MAG: hypothetical protein H0V66_04660 [Bdellovibrionales bacterium]|nr:hypothetical protein [Bdellovibrionales bacterium]